MMWFAFIVVIAVGVLYKRYLKKEAIEMPLDFPQVWKVILNQKVLFYQNLPTNEKTRFEQDISRFLKNVRITGVKTEVDITDKLLVASSAAIPVFGFPHWDYTFLDEVLLYPDSFDSDYTINSKDETITGMVGSGGVMEGKMILSKPSLHRGFENDTDKKNVGIHEFVHLLDKEDGSIDGIPATLANKKFSIPWLRLIREKTTAIQKGGEDINPYATTNESEFFAVLGEYFFERPHLLQQKHPALYTLLTKAFNQDTASTFNISVLPKRALERNDPCPCGSGKKFKRCCIIKS